MQDSGRRRPVIQSLEADGAWCPMAHCNRNDDSFHDLPPLVEVHHSKSVRDPTISPFAFSGLGAFTGETMAVCVYPSPAYPALVAFDYQDGSVRWRSPLEDLPGLDRRRIPGILLAKIRVGQAPTRRYVFAANPSEFVAYGEDGALLWKQGVDDLVPGAAGQVGAPTSLRFTDGKELVTSTSRGWVLKLNPLDGSLVDAYRMRTGVVLGGRLCQGVFVSFKSSVVVGNVLYLMAKFRPHRLERATPLIGPIYLVRLDLGQPDALGGRSVIRPLAQPASRWDAPPDRLRIGVSRVRGGSPSAMVTRTGGLLVLANAEMVSDGALQPVVAAVEDDRGVLHQRWRCVLAGIPGNAIHGAPALHPDSQTLLVSTLRSLYRLGNIEGLSGLVPSPSPIPGSRLLSRAGGGGRMDVRLGSPIGLTFDRSTGDIVAYTNLRVMPVPGSRMFGFLGSFALSADPARPLRPLWSRPLAVTADGQPAPGPGTWGQPALFRYRKDGAEATGLILNTVLTGTHLFK